MAKKPAVFLDRDGTLIRTDMDQGKPVAVLTPEDMEMEPGADKAVARLREAGFLTVMATNQPDVATGRQDRMTVEIMNDAIARYLSLDDVTVCYHVDEDGCACRKPKPGMLTDAAERLDIDLAKSFMVGDRWRDVEAGKAAGCTTIWIDRDYNEPLTVDPDYTVTSLIEAVLIILTLVDYNPQSGQ